MKAFVAVVASLAASAKAQVLLNPYNAGLYAGAPVAYAGAPVAYAGAPVAYAGAPITTVAAAPVATVAAAPVPLPAAPLSQQFHSQDEFGNVAHGYSNINSAKHEAGNTYAGVTGGYKYIDANGELQQVEYIADGRGFQVSATNLPVAPVAAAFEFDPKDLPVAPTFNPALPVAPTFDPALPVAPVDTAEVAAAKEAHAAAVAEVNAREKRSTPAATEPLVVPDLPLAPYTYAGAYAPFAGAYGYPFAGAYAHGAYAHAPVFAGAYAHAPVAPLAYNAPLVAPAAPATAVVATAPGAAEATLTKVKLNPGHAIAYRVD